MTIGRPTRPGPFFYSESAQIPRAKTGIPTSSIPNISRTVPSVTIAATNPTSGWRFRGFEVQRL
ncbi:hypothetical protein D1AOALGA4SA_11015 [Olavius algarvensis Delta 1 endosymbiont]|nr:hypothetical protein D1AOALGA4SA_11015 [Olavius algarvensis Delta 1 endosymbiont]